MSESYDFADIDRLCVGTVGEPGHRLFLIQLHTTTRVVTMKVEKQQVEALAQYLGG